MCFVSNATSRWMPGGGSRRFRVDVQIDVGEMGIDYSEVARKEHLNQLEIEVSQRADSGLLPACGIACGGLCCTRSVPNPRPAPLCIGHPAFCRSAV